MLSKIGRTRPVRLRNYFYFDARRARYSFQSELLFMICVFHVHFDNLAQRLLCAFEE